MLRGANFYVAHLISRNIEISIREEEQYYCDNYEAIEIIYVRNRYRFNHC